MSRSKPPASYGQPGMKRVDWRQCSNSFGDTIFKDGDGHIAAFKYSDEQSYYSFEYGADGSVSSINRSDGWTWRRVRSGWAVRNYFESWAVGSGECQNVVVDDSGVRAIGPNPTRMGLPEKD